ncbi:hypothetical protein D3C73_684570 [compost metagenome]
MWLVDHHQAALRPATAHGLDHSRDFGRVVAVVIDQHHVAAVHRQFAVDLEASADTLEPGQALDDGFIADAFVGGDADGRQRVQHVVVARHVDRNIQRLAVRPQYGEEGLHALLAHIDGAHVAVFAEAVGDGRTLDLREDFTHHRIVQAHHCQTVERQVVQELDEGFLQLVEVTVVGRHVVGVDVGDHGHQRLQVQEAGVAFVGFGDQVAAGAKLGIGARGIQAATDHECRVQATGGEHRSDQAGGRGFAVGTGNGDTVAITHQLSQHLCTRYHRNAAFQRSSDFRVGRVHGARHHQYVSGGGVLGAVADEDLRPEGFQALGDRGRLQVGAGHGITQVQQHFGDPAHAHTADTDEVDATDAAHFRLRHGFLTLNHGPPPGSYRPRYGWHRVWPGGVPR